MSQDVQERWTYHVHDTICCITLSRDGRLVFAGSKNGQLYCFERSGDLLWQGNVEGKVNCLALAEGYECVVVGCADSKAYLWNYDGHFLRAFETAGAIQRMALTPTAHRIALATDRGEISLFNSTGTALWQSTHTSSVRSLSLTPDGQAMVVGSDDTTHIYLFDQEGREQLFNTITARFWANSQEIPLAIVGFKDQQILLFDSSGHVRWSYKTNDKITAAAITCDSRTVAVSTARVILLFNDVGNLLWQFPTANAVHELILSNDGRFVIARTQNQTPLLLDAAGINLWTQPPRQKTYAVAITPNGRLMATAQDFGVSVFENLQAPEDMSDAWLAQTILPQIHWAYANSPQLGIATWFESFDHALLRRELALCQSLLQEIRASGYKLSASELDAVTSREGSLLLYQGLLYQRHGETERAQQAYEQSSEIQHRSHYLVGEGQALSALQMLRNGLDEDTPALLALLERPPELLGSSEALLVQGMSSMSPFEQLQVVLAARRRGYLTPLLAALTSLHTSVQTAAATALTWLQPGPEMNTLLDLLTSPHWLIRWQVSLMLTQRARQQVLTSQHEEARRAIVECLTQEEDPLVRRNLVLLLGIIGDSSHEAVLLPLLADPDSDVRMAVVETLGLIGTRRAVTALREVKQGTDFAGRSIKELTGTALEHIYQRYPLTVVQKVVCCQELPAGGKPVQPKTLFFPNTPVFHCVVTLADPSVGARISCIAQFQSSAPIQRENAQLQPLWTIDPEPPSTDMIFSFAPTKGAWLSGVYAMEVSLDGKLQEQLSIKIINQVPIKRAVMCSGLNEDGDPIDERTTFIDGHDICCSVALGETPVGLEVKGEAYRIEKATTNSASRGFFRNLLGKMIEKAGREDFIMESNANTVVEGEQTLALFWKVHGWPPGDYIIKLTTSTGTEASCTFQIVSPSTRQQ